MDKKIAVYRLEHFNAAHRLHNPDWSDEKNLKVFGKCNNANYHGHNYNLEVEVKGYVDKETGYLIDLKILSDLIKEQVLDPFDHKNLNIEVPEFKNLNPTAENIAMVIYNKLTKALNDNSLEIAIKLYETERNYVKYPA